MTLKQEEMSELMMVLMMNKAGRGEEKVVMAMVPSLVGRRQGQGKKMVNHLEEEGGNCLRVALLLLL